MRISHLPRDDDDNGWEHILPARTARPALAGDVTADLLIIGAGFAGLGAAWRAAQLRPNDRIILLDAQRIGDGASGRNSGFVIATPHNVRNASLDQLSGVSRSLRIAKAAGRFLDDIVTTHQIRCDWRHDGEYVVAVSGVGERALERTHHVMAALGEEHRVLGARETAAELGTSYYRAAIHAADTYLMNPVALVRGLADRLPPAVALHERSPVIEIDYGSRIVARTPQGSVTAARVILAVNSFAPRFGFYGGRIFPMRLYASLTRPLDEAEQRALGAKPWAVISTHPGTGCTMRYTEDHRILIRHIGEYGGGYDPMAGHQMDARRVHMDLFRRRFPMLPNVAFAHTWAGFTCMSRNFGYGFSQPANNVFTAVCENGVGATNSTMAGALAAERAYAIDNPLIADFEAMGAPAPAMSEPLLRLGVGLHMRRVAFEGRAEV